MKIKQMAAASLALVMALVLGACSDTSGPGDSSSVTLQGRLATTAVAKIVAKGGEGELMAGDAVDSMHVTRVRALVTRIKLHRDKEDTVAGDRTVKTGPVLFVADSNGLTTFATGTVPAGTYDKVKFEFHRFSSSEISQYLNDTLFGPFVTNERSSFIIEGNVYVNGAPVPFTYSSDVTANLSLKLPTAVDVANGGAAVVIVEIDPAEVFRHGGKILDPRDPRNESEIDNAIKDAIRALKK